MVRYVIGFREHGQLRFVRLYANRKTWTTRKHASTATPFSSRELALTSAKQMGIDNPEIVIY
jgi:hypothetical protein